MKKIAVFALASVVPVAIGFAQTGPTRLARSHRPTRQGSDASNNLCSGTQVRRGQSCSRERAADLWDGGGRDGRGHRRADDSPR